MKVRLSDIFFIFFKMGWALLGGGYVILPLIKSELIEKRNWLNEEELIDFYSISQCIPGMIAVNISVFVGEKLRGTKGAIMAALGISLPAFIPIVLLAQVLSKFANTPFMLSFFWGISIGVVILILLTVKEMWNQSVVDKFSFLIFTVAFLLMQINEVSPVIVIVSAAIIGILYKKIKGEQK